MAPYSKENSQASRLVLTAIKNLNLQGGATLKNINDYIKEKYPNCQSSEFQLKKVIDKALAFGALTKTRNRYDLGEVLDHVVMARRRRRKSDGEKKHRRRRRRRH